MAFDPDAYLSTPTAKGGFNPDEFLKEPSKKSVAGFGHNLVEDVKDTATGIGHLAQGMVEHPIDTTASVAKNIIPGVVEEGKRLGVGELLTGHPINAIEKLGNAAYEKPLTTALSVVPAASAAGKVAGAGMKALRGAGLAEDAANIAAKTAAKEAPAALAAEDLISVPKGTPGKTLTMQAAEDFANNPPKPPPVPEPPKPPLDPLKEVSEYVTSKYGQTAAKPGLIEKMGQYLKNEAADLRGKDIGLSPMQIKSMGTGFEGIEKAEALMDYAGQKGYFRPGLTDVSRKALIKSAMEKAGQQVGAIRDIAAKRGAPPMEAMLQELKTQLTKSYGIDAPGEVEKVLAKFNAAAKENPTFTGMADLSTDLNKAKTAATKLGQHPGPTTDAANIISRMNNDAIRSVLNPEEAKLYTESLRDFGAHKKLEQAVSMAGRKSMAGRGGAVGSLTNRLVQGILDRGGYRMAGNIANKMGTSMVENPAKFGSLPKFFEELAHHADDVLDETIGGMAHGGIAGFDPDELNRFLVAKYEKPKEKK